MATEAAIASTDVQTQVGSRYRLDGVAGAGGMGCVYSAMDTVLGRRVAVKLMRRPGADAIAPISDDQRARLVGEARAMARLNHPNLCRVLEVGLDGPAPFIVMDWIDGIELHQAWQPMDLERRLAMFLKIVEAVAAAHQAGLVHRDLKPGNIVVDRRGEPVIVDFGLARVQDFTATTTHTVAGTPGYSAPEQFAADQRVGATADVYALGVLLFQLMTDRLPFEGVWMEELLSAVRLSPPPLPETFVPGLPWPLQRICLTALEAQPELRYPHAGAMLQDLRRYLAGETVAARPSVLAQQFDEQVELQLRQVEVWRSQGLVTEREANRLASICRRLLRPESHWILDSRRLSISQVTLYVGGWLVLVGLLIGLTLSWSALSHIPGMRYGLAWGAAGAVLALGVALHRRGDFRVSLAFLMTACLAIPVAAALLLRETNWLSGAVDGAGQVIGMGDREWLSVLMDTDPARGLLNRQVLAMTALWCGCCVWLRMFSRSSAFTPLAVIAAMAAWFALWASAGWLQDERESFAVLGAWFAGLGAAACWPGLRLNQREEIDEVRQGRGRASRDSWAVLTGAMVMMIAGLTLMAWNAPDVYTFNVRDRPDQTSRAVAFLINGVVLQLIAYLLERSRTIVRGRLAELIRWITPQHFLGALLALETDAEGAAQFMWIAALAVGSLALCYLSVVKQWRPFMITGLLYLAIAYFETFRRIGERYKFDWLDLMDDSKAAEPSLNLVRLVLTGGCILLGIAAMVFAWKVPGWIAAARARDSTPP